MEARDINELPSLKEVGVKSVFPIADGGRVYKISVNEAFPEQEIKFTGEATINVGGVTAGEFFNDLPIQEVVNAIISPELFPSFVAPSVNFTSTISGLREIGTTVSFTLIATFDRGLITPQYHSQSPYRSGMPNTYHFTGALVDTVETDNMSVSQSVSDFIVPLGNTTYTVAVSYDKGVQPKSNRGNDYDVWLPAGTTGTKSVTITGVYPVYAGITLVKSALQAHGGTITVNAPDDMGGERFKIQYPSVWKATQPTVQQYNTITKDWEAQPMSEYEITAIDKDGVPYKQVKYVGAGISARQLRLVF